MRFPKRARPLALTAAVVLLLALFAAPVFGQDSGGGVQGVDQAIAAQERHNASLLAIGGVIGTGVGEGPGARAAIFVFTGREGVAGIPRKLDGVAVIPHVTGKVYAGHHRPGHGNGGGDATPTPTTPPSTTDCATTARCPRPVPIGVSTGHPLITAGTIGARVTNGTGVFALSNNHVYANENLANIGDNALQPGPIDGGITADAIGTLSAFVPLQFEPTLNDNVMDAAIVSSSTGNLGRWTVSACYGTPKSAPASTVSLNLKVQKCGRTTVLTKGFVWATNVTLDVCYDAGCTKIAHFVGQIAFKGTSNGGTFSAGGDSGSLIVTNARNPVALLFAGNSFYTFGNPIGPVLTSFGVTVDGE